jgi:hypothetical protein
VDNVGASARMPSRLRKADDGSRTRDLELGKLALYQLSYVRVAVILRPWRRSGAGGI